MCKKWDKSEKNGENYKGEVRNMRKRNKKTAPEDRPLADLQARETDPQGSWTGVPADRFEEPVQDADDL